MRIKLAINCGKNYTIASFDNISKQPIFTQVINGKSTGNFKMFIDGRSITVTKPKELKMKPTTEYRDAYYKVDNWYLKNPYQINKDITDFTESVLPGIPSYGDIGYGAAIGTILYEKYKELKTNESQSVSSFCSILFIYLCI